MKNRLLALFLLVLALPFLSGATLPGKYSLIVPYQAPPENSLSKVRIYEVFAFDCSHCYTFHHTQRAVLMRKFGDKVEFISKPIGWRGEKPGRVYFIAEEKGVGEEALNKIFSAVRSGIDLYNDMELLKQVATDFIGLSEKDFARIEDPAIVKKMRDSAEYAKIRKVSGTPTVIIEDVMVAEKSVKNLEAIIKHLLKKPVP